MTSTLARCLCSILVVTAWVYAPAAHAYDVVGTFKNGTTGEPIANAPVMLVNPSGGMIAEQQGESDAEGAFRFSDLDEDAAIYLMRAPYQGINYTKMVRFTGDNELRIELVAYEPTTSWDDVSVSIPQMVVSRWGADSLRVEKFFVITNQTSPPRTVTGADARFKFFVPEDNLGIHSLTTMSLGVPLPRSPIPTDDPGFYAMEFPIKPGETQVAMSYSLPYASGAYRYVDRFMYTIDEMMVFTDDPDMHVHCDYPGFAKVDDVQGFSAFRVANLQAGNEIIIDFEGGAGQTVDHAEHAADTRVFILPATSNNASLVMMLVTFVAFAGLLGFAIAAQREKDVEKRVLHERREELLNQLARLEDLHQAGAVSDVMFKTKRTELMSALAQIYYRTKIDTTASKTPEEPAAVDPKGAPSV